MKLLRLFVLLYCCFSGGSITSSQALLAQTGPGPVAFFSFNDKHTRDVQGKKNAEIVGASFAPDRFGNENSAVYVFGNEFSYINLGSDPSLKTSTGSISFWVKLESEVFSGTGYKCNPLIITKRSKSDDFFEAYGIYYMLDTKKVAVNCAEDSLRQMAVTSIEKFELFKWHHLAISFDDRYLTFYIDGKLEKKIIKKFKTTFLSQDPILIGVTANKKNNRFTQGAFDDVAFYDRVLSGEEIAELYRAPNPNKQKILINRILIVLGITLLIALLYLVIRYRINILYKRERKHLELTNKLLENELRINRALMNPHFIFNSLNTLHNYILKDNAGAASDFLMKFSKLIRKILDSNMSDNISLDLEIELIERYLEIEGMRFKDNFDYSLRLDPTIVPSTLVIPIMMLQPFVENAVWHGLRDKIGEKNVTVSISRYESAYLLCEIEDNGTGRKKSVGGNSIKKSLATGFVLQRLDLINKIYNLHCTLTIIDKPDGAGTIVKLILPILNL